MRSAGAARIFCGCCRRNFDAVLVWKIDRFGRSLKHLVNALAELCAYGVAFVSFRDNLDLSTPSGRLMFQIIGAMAEFERSLIQERVRAGLRNARAKGKTFGRPRVEIDAARVAQSTGSPPGMLSAPVHGKPCSLTDNYFCFASDLTGKRIWTISQVAVPGCNHHRHPFSEAA